MYEKYVKRAIDVIGALVLLVITWPFMVIAAIGIKVEDLQHPVLFTQERPGKDEKIFKIYKFRTMKMETHDAQGNSLSDIQRMTRVGNILRKTSFDEVPQSSNILKGDRGIIGIIKRNIDFSSVVTA